MNLHRSENVQGDEEALHGCKVEGGGEEQSSDSDTEYEYEYEYTKLATAKGCAVPPLLQVLHPTRPAKAREHLRVEPTPNEAKNIHMYGCSSQPEAGVPRRSP